METVGYARVSSTGQSLDVQLEKLQACDRIFQEKRSGTSLQRPKLEECLAYVRQNDILVVTRLDRLARSTLHLCQIADTLEKKNVALRVLDQSIDTTDATGRLIFHVLGSISQFETEIRAERQMEGILKAKEKGVQFGRSKHLNEREILELQQRRVNGTLIRELMADYKLSKASIYRYLAQDKQ
ncbi:MAG TPA: recombinase family protein [Ktedonobacteraceae bacterium]|jgi:DNA invertase Pin-like site-specific DNA recombinase